MIGMFLSFNFWKIEMWLFYNKMFLSEKKTNLRSKEMERNVSVVKNTHLFANKGIFLLSLIHKVSRDFEDYSLCFNVIFTMNFTIIAILNKNRIIWKNIP